MNRYNRIDAIFMLQFLSRDKRRIIKRNYKASEIYEAKELSWMILDAFLQAEILDEKWLNTVYKTYLKKNIEEKVENVDKLFYMIEAVAQDSFKVDKEEIKKNNNGTGTIEIGVVKKELEAL